MFFFKIVRITTQSDEATKDAEHGRPVRLGGWEGGGGQREVEWGGRGSLAYVGQAEESILQVCQLTEVKETKDREKYPNHFRYLFVRPFYWKSMSRSEWQADSAGSQSKLSSFTALMTSCYVHDEFSSVQFKMVSMLLQKPICAPPPSLKSFPNVAFETVPMFV